MKTSQNCCKLSYICKKTKRNPPSSTSYKQLYETSRFKESSMGYKVLKFFHLHQVF